MAYLTTSELAAIREHIEATLPDTCTIEQPTETVDSVGAVVASWPTRASDVPCRLAQAVMSGAYGRFSTVAGEQTHEGLVWVLSLPHDQTIEVKDRVVVSGVTYYVRSVNVGESEMFLKRCIVEPAL